MGSKTAGAVLHAVPSHHPTLPSWWPSPITPVTTMVATVACPVPLFSFFLLSRSAGHRLLAACGVGLEGWGCCAVFPP